MRAHRSAAKHPGDGGHRGQHPGGHPAQIFEDVFVAKLVAVDAEASYRYIPEDGQADEVRITEAVKQAPADAAIIARQVRRDKKTGAIPGVYQPAPAITFGLYPGYSAAWLGYYEPPRIRQYDVFVSETSVSDVARNQLVRTGTVETANPGDIDKRSGATWTAWSRRSRTRRVL